MSNVQRPIIFTLAALLVLAVMNILARHDLDVRMARLEDTKEYRRQKSSVTAEIDILPPGVGETHNIGLTMDWLVMTCAIQVNGRCVIDGDGNWIGEIP